jgi:COMPASS component SWD3
LGSLDT